MGMPLSEVDFQVSGQRRKHITIFHSQQNTNGSNIVDLQVILDDYLVTVGVRYLEQMERQWR